HCKPCGVTIDHTYTVRKANRAYHYYTCYVAQKRGRDACRSNSLPAEQIERFVVEQIRCIGKDPTLVSAAIEKVRRQHDETVAALQCDLRVVERDMARLNGEIRRASSGAKKDASHLADLHDQLRAAEQRQSELVASIEQTNGETITPDEMEAALA